MVFPLEMMALVDFFSFIFHEPPQRRIVYVVVFAGELKSVFSFTLHCSSSPEEGADHF